MFPEISRRCLECGASVRAGARFCPQCGKEMEGAEDAAGADGKAVGVEAKPSPASMSEARAGRGDVPSLEDSWNRWQESLRQRAAGGSKASGEAGAQPAPHDAATLYDAPSPRDAGATREEGGPKTVAETPAPPQAPPQPLPQPQPLRRPAGETLVGRLKEGAAPSAASPVEPDGASVLAAGESQKGRRAAAVREAVRPRVEKVREASLGVLEGAAEDSGLRFVLISVGLFLLFLFFLLLNSWLK
jgi:hypothetical protein